MTDSDRAAHDAELVAALCAVESGLSEWEMDFVESIRRQLAAKRDRSETPVLSDKQRQKALEIAEDHDV